MISEGQGEISADHWAWILYIISSEQTIMSVGIHVNPDDLKIGEFCV